jgi:hypothetical protein
LGSRLLRRFFCDIGIPSVAWTGARNIRDRNDARLFSDVRTTPKKEARPLRSQSRQTFPAL